MSDVPPLQCSQGPGRIFPVPADLRSVLAPATWCVFEWTDYAASFAGADRLKIGSTWVAPIANDTFVVRFENQLGLTTLTPYLGNAPCGTPIHIEVLARKFSGPHASVDFLRAIIGDLYTRTSSLPFFAVAVTERKVRESHRPPNDLFTFHFFRTHGLSLILDLQAIMGRPHQVLSDESAMVRLHEVKTIETESILRLLQGGRHSGRKPSLGDAPSPLQTLQLTQVWQRLPADTFDTPENRFIVTICRRMHQSIEQLERVPWYRQAAVPASVRLQISRVKAHLAILATDRRFAGLEQSNRVPTQSRVLQRRDGYRELTTLWHLFQRARQPVFEQMQAAIDLRNIADLYEIWVLFELIDQLQTITRAVPTMLQAHDRLGLPTHGLTARFGDAGLLRYNPSFRGYSGIGLRPDFTWTTANGKVIVLDAKFRMRNPKAWLSNHNDASDPDASRVQDDDLQKMHTYRDAIPGVRAAMVLYPGTTPMFRNTAGTALQVSIERIVEGELDGIGAIPLRPVTLSADNEGDQT